MFLASTPISGAPMAGGRQQAFAGTAQTANLNAAGQAATATGREVTGLSIARQILPARVKGPIEVTVDAAMSAASTAASNSEVQP